MKLYECNLSTDTKTTFIIDDIFNPLNGYTGVSFRGGMAYVTKVGLVVPIIIAGIERGQDCYWHDYSGHCTMTELKNFLCRRSNTLDVKKNPEGLGWTKEVLNALSKIEKNVENKNLYRKFNWKYKLRAQGLNEYQTYGKDWQDLILDGFFLECLSFVGNEKYYI